MSVQLLNVHKFSSKAGKRFCIIQYLRPINQREKDNGYFGEFISVEQFLPEDCIDKVNASDVGKEIEFVYDVIDGKAYLKDIKVLKILDNTKTFSSL